MSPALPSKIAEEVLAREPHIVAGWLRCDRLDDLILYNYTQRCVRERAWDVVTLNSRGIIFNWRTGECVARPFPRIFNYDETVGELPWKQVLSIEEKLDGHLGILYRHHGRLRITTCGRFESDSALLGTELLQQHNLVDLDERLTLLFEIVSPWTRVVIDYGERHELVLLAAIDRHGHDEQSLATCDELAARYGFSRPARFLNTYETLNTLLAAGETDPHCEGFVVRFGEEQGPLRVKFKTQSYLARLAARHFRWSR